jgi:hypothetical protein
MSAGIVRSLARTDKLALGLAVGTTAAVGAAAFTNHGLTAPEAIGALTLAGVIGTINVRTNFPRRPHTLTPVAEVEGGVIIRADRARSMAAHPTAQPVGLSIVGRSHSDAA